MTRLSVNDLLPNTNYAIRLRAVGVNDVSEWSNRLVFLSTSDTVKPAIPTGVSWVVSGDSFHAEWNAVTTNIDGNTIPVTRYEVELVGSGNGTGTRFDSVSPGTGNKVVYDLSFEQNRAMFTTVKPIIAFRVRAVDNKELKSDFSTVVSATNDRPANVANLVGTVGVDQMTLKWDSVADADLTRYEAYVGTASNFTPTLANRVFSGLANTFSYTSATYTPHYFKVRAVDKFEQASLADTTSAALTPISPYVVDTTPPGPPTAASVTTAYDATRREASLTVNWTAPAGVTDLQNFTVRYGATATGPWNYITADKDATTITIPATPGQVYHTGVRAVDFSGNVSGWAAATGSPITAGADSTAPAQITGLTASAQGTSFIASWSPSLANDFKEYEIGVFANAVEVFYKTTATRFDFTFEMNRAAFSGARNSVQFRVRAIDIGGNLGAWSANNSPTNAAPAAPTSLTNAIGAGAITIGWTPPSDTDLIGYNVYQGTAANPTSKVAFTDSTTFSTTANTSPQYFVVKAVDAFLQESGALAGGPFTANNPFIVDTTAPAVPVLSSIVLQNRPTGAGAVAQATWTHTAEPDLAGFTLRHKRPTADTNWNYTVVSKDARTATLSLFHAYQAYDFQIAAFDNSANYSAWSATTSVAAVANVAPAQVMGLTSSSNETNFNASWTATTEPDVFNYEVGVSNGTTEVFYNTASNRFEFSLAENRKSFTTPASSVTFRVRSTDSEGLAGPWSTNSVASFATLAAPTNLTNTVGANSITVGWTASTSIAVSGYNVYQGTAANPTTKVGFVNGTSYTATVPNTTPQFFSIKTLDSFGRESAALSGGGFTATNPFIVDTTAPAVPGGLAATLTNNPNGVGATAAVNWTLGSDTDRSYVELQYKRTSDATWASMVLSKDELNAYPSLSTANVGYDFRVRAVDTSGNASAFTTTVSKTGVAAVIPNTPTGLTATAGRDSIVYNWVGVSNTDLRNYEVTFSTSSTFASGNITYITGTATTLTVSGLTPNTTYYARVKAVTQAVLSSGWTATNTATTGIFPQSDGTAPTSSPTPTVVGGLGYLYATWTPVTNADPVTYEVHMSTTSGFTPAAGTKVTEVSGTFALLDVLPGTSTPLTYGTTYYVKLIAKDRDGAAVAGAQGSAAPARASGTDVDIEAGAFNLLRDSSFKVGTFVTTGTASGTKALDTTVGRTDTRSLKVTLTNTAQGNASHHHGVWVNTPGVPNTHYTFSSYFKAPVGTTFYVQLIPKNVATGHLYGNSILGTVTPAVVDANGWYRASVSTTPAIESITDLSGFEFRVFPTNLTTGDIYWLDDLQLETANILSAYAPNPQDALDDVNTRVDTSVRNYVTEYYLSTSESTQTGGTWSTNSPTRTPGSFVWYRVVTTYQNNSSTTSNPALLTGNTGAQGTSATTVNLTSTTQVLTAPSTGGTTNPTTAVITGTPSGTTIADANSVTSGWSYSVDGAAFSATLPAGLTRTVNQVTITGSAMTAKTITVKAIAASGVADTMTVARVLDGATGADAYTVLLTNEAMTFAGSTTAALGGTETTSVLALKGTASQNVTVNAITGATGISAAVTSGQGTASPVITVTVTSALTATSGTLSVPLTIDGMPFTKTISWAVTRQGAQGNPGDQGAGTWTPVYTLTNQPTPGKFVKNTGAANGWTNSSVHSVQGFVDGAFVSMQPTGAAASNIMMGLNSDPALDSNFSSIDYAWYWNGTAGIPQWVVYESGTSSGAQGGAVTDTASIVYDGSSVRYYLNGVLKKTTARPETTALYLDSSFFHADSGFQNVAFGPLGRVGVSVTAITPYFATVTTGAAAPAAPANSVSTPPGPWGTTEPAYTANTELYRMEKNHFSDGTQSYTVPTKVSSYAAAVAAVNSANGVNRVFYSTAVASGTAQGGRNFVAGDTWYQRDGAGKIIGQWEFTTIWEPRQVSHQMISSIDIGTATVLGKLKAGNIDLTIGGGNLITNSNNAAGLLYFAARGNLTATIASVANTEVSGANAIELTSLATNQDIGATWADARIPVVAGDILTASIYAKAITVTGTAPLRLGVEFFNSSGAYVGGDYDTTLVGVSSMKRLINTVTIPTGTFFVNMMVYTGTGTALNDKWLVKNWQLERGDVATGYSPKPDEILPGTITGDMLNTNFAVINKTLTLGQDAANPGNIKSWDYNVANKKGFNFSSAGLTVYEGVIKAKALDLTIGGGNSVYNSSFENGFTGWIIRGGGSVVSSSVPYYGAKSMNLNSTAGTTISIRGSAGYGAENSLNLIRVTPGRQYTITTWFTGGGGVWRVGYEWLNSPGVYNSETLGGDLGVTGTLTKITYTATAPAGANYVTPRIDCMSAGAGATLGAVQIEEGDFGTSYSPKPDEIMPGTIKGEHIEANTSLINNLNIGTGGSIRSSNYTSSGGTTGYQISETGIILKTGSVDANLLTANTTITTNLGVTGTLTMGTGGVIQSAVVNSTTGYKITSTGIEMYDANSKISAAALQGGTISATSQIVLGPNANLVVNGGYIKSNTNTGTTLATAETSNAGFFLNADGLFIGGTSRIKANALISDTLTSTTIKLGTNGFIESADYNGTSLGFRLSSTGLDVFKGTIRAQALSIAVGGGNLLTNASFDDSVSYSANWSVSGTGAKETVITHRGGASMKLTRAAGALALVQGTGLNLLQGYVGESVTASAWVYPTVANMTVRMNYQNAAGNSIGTFTFTTLPINTWTRISGTGATTVAGTDYRIRVYCDAGVDGILYVDDLQVEAGDILTSYAPKPDEILPGTIQGNMVKADSIDAGVLKADTAINQNLNVTSTLIMGTAALPNNGIMRSWNYSSGTAGWNIQALNGSAEFNNVTVRGTVYATAGTFAGSLSAATGTFTGSLTGASGTFSGSLTAGSGTINGLLDVTGASAKIALNGTTGPRIELVPSGLKAYNAGGETFSINALTGAVVSAGPFTLTNASITVGTGTISGVGFSLGANGVTISNAGSSTSIDGGVIKTGSIQSTSMVTVNGSSVPKWSINTTGGATFAAAQILGDTIIGNATTDATTLLRSTSWVNTSSTVGWALRGDGNAWFNQVTVAGNSTFGGNITATNATITGGILQSATIRTSATVLTAGGVLIDTTGIKAYTGNTKYLDISSSGVALTSGNITLSGTGNLNVNGGNITVSTGHIRGGGNTGSASGNGFFMDQTNVYIGSGGIVKSSALSISAGGENLIVGSNFEGKNALLEAYSGGTYAYQDTVASNAMFGKTSLAVTPGAVNRGVIVWSNIMNANYELPVSTSIVGSVWLKAAAGVPLTVNYRIRNAVSSYLVEGGGVSLSATGAWQRVVLPAYVYSTGVFIPGIQVVQTGGTLGTFHIDAPQIEIGDLATAYTASTTFIDGSQVTTGLIQSSSKITIDGVTDQPVWRIDTTGAAYFANLRVYGNSVVGNSVNDNDSVLQSSNYKQGEMGWIIRGNGWSEFRQVTAGSLNVSSLGGGTLDGEIGLAEGASLAANGLMGEKVSLAGTGFLVRGPQEVAVSTRAATASVVTITTSIPHGFADNSKVQIILGEPRFDGIYTATVTSTTTFTYSRSGTVVSSGAAAVGAVVKGKSSNSSVPIGPTYVNFPADGGQPNIISGELTATNLTVSNGMSIRNASTLERGATLTLNSTIQPPSLAPTAESGYAEASVFTANSPINKVYDVTNNAANELLVLGTTNTTTNSAPWLIGRYTKTGDYLGGVALNHPATNFNNNVTPVSIVYANMGGTIGVRYFIACFEHNTSTGLAKESVYVYNSTFAHVGTYTFATKTSVNNPEIDFSWKIGWDYTFNSLCYAYKQTETQIVVYRGILMSATGVPTALDETINLSGTGTSSAIGFIGRGSYDMGADKIVLKDVKYNASVVSGREYSVFSTAGVSTPTYNWPVANGSWVVGGFYDTTYSQFNDITRSSGLVRTYYGSDSYWISSDMAAARYIRYSWYNSSVGSTPLSPAARLSMTKRSRPEVTVAPIPYAFTGSATPNVANVYQYKGESDIFPTLVGYDLRAIINYPGTSAQFIPGLGPIGPAATDQNAFGNTTGNPAGIYSATGLSFWKGDDVAQFKELRIVPPTSSPTVPAYTVISGDVSGSSIESWVNPTTRGTFEIKSDSTKFNVVGGSVTVEGGTNINGKFKTNTGVSGGGTALVLKSNQIVAGTEQYNATSNTSSNTVNFIANELHAVTGLFDDSYVGGGSTGATINLNGRVIRTPSSRRFKHSIEDLDFEVAKNLLGVKARTFLWNEDMDMGDYRTPGFIAEEAEEAGATMWVAYDAEGQPAGIRYAEITVAHHALIQRLFRDKQTQNDRIDAMETEKVALEERLTRLEALVEQMNAQTA